MPPDRSMPLADAGPPYVSTEAWVLATFGRAVAYAASLLQDRSAAEDVVQDCCCRLLRRADQCDLLNDGTKLLFRAVTNACINLTQRGRRHASLDARDDEPGAPPLADAKAASPEALAVRNELDEAVRAALAELPAEQRAALELKSLGHSQAEIAEALGKTSTHVGVLIHRARRALKVRLAAYLPEDFA